MPKQSVPPTTQLMRAKSRRPMFLGTHAGTSLGDLRPPSCAALALPEPYLGAAPLEACRLLLAPEFALALQKQSLRFTFSDPRLTTHFATDCICNPIWIQIAGEVKCVNSKRKTAFANAFGLHLHPNALRSWQRIESNQFKNLTSKEANACQPSLSF